MLTEFSYLNAKVFLGTVIKIHNFLENILGLDCTFQSKFALSIARQTSQGDSQEKQSLSTHLVSGSLLPSHFPLEISK